MNIGVRRWLGQWNCGPGLVLVAALAAALGGCQSARLGDRATPPQAPRQGEAESPSPGPANTASPPPAPKSASPSAASPPAVQPGDPPATKPAAKPESPSPAKPPVQSPAPSAAQSSPEIAIDQSICGAGGQEAYFKTKGQEIYICKNEAGALTYIATPKQGNSIFLPVQKVQQGDTTGYVALDQAKTYIVTAQGFQLKENSKVLASEKVIQRQMPDN